MSESCHAVWPNGRGKRKRAFGVTEFCPEKCHRKLKHKKTYFLSQAVLGNMKNWKAFAKISAVNLYFLKLEKIWKCTNHLTFITSSVSLRLLCWMLFIFGTDFYSLSKFIMATNLYKKVHWQDILNQNVLSVIMLKIWNIISAVEIMT